MRNLLRNMPWPVEFAIVVAGAFGLSIVSSLYLAFHPPSGALHSEPEMWRMIGRQVVVLLILGGFLLLRGWNFERMGLQSHWMDGLHGLALAAAAYLTFIVAIIALDRFLPRLAEQAAKLEVMPKVLSPWIVAAVVLINSFYEEFFVSGYVITALKERAGETVAINVSVVIRLLYHLYQGVVGVIGMIPVGLIFGYWYARTNKLWPLMVAHAAINLVGMLQYVKF
jgi:CAAX protease family protein